MAKPEARQTEIRITCLDEPAAAILARTRDVLAGTSGVDIIDDPDRVSERGYYTGLCYKIHATTGDQRLEIADGGFVDWTGQTSQHPVTARAAPTKGQ